MNSYSGQIGDAIIIKMESSHVSMLFEIQHDEYLMTFIAVIKNAKQG
jgi:hypothetical protein